MQAIAGHLSVERSAVEALSAGCDVLLVCSRAEAQERVHRALCERIETDGAFRRRCVDAARRSLAMRRRCPPRPGSAEDLDALLRAEVTPLEAELAVRLS